MEAENLSTSDFKHTEKTNIQCSEFEYSFLSPGIASQYDWKDYAPAVFRNIQEQDNITHDDYKHAISRLETIYDVSSATGHGAFFNLPHDDRFVIKTLKKSEVKELLEMLPNYFQHLKKYGASLLAKYYGLHYIRPNRGVKVYFVVMANVLKSERFIHLQYDLKGSSRGRTISKVEFGQKTILKEMDLDFQFYLKPLTRVLLMSQIKFDCEFLETEGVMDYSLLMGIHVETSHQGVDSGKHSYKYAVGSGKHSNKDIIGSGKHSNKYAVGSGKHSNKDIMGSGKHYNKDVVSEDGMLSEENVELTTPKSSESCSKPEQKFGVNMPAQAIRIPKESNGRTPRESNSGSDRTPKTRKAKTKESYNVFLYFGIVDLLQSYGVGKRLEHAYKSIQYDSKSISAVNPKAYSSRFQEFLSTIFQDDSCM